MPDVDPNHPMESQSKHEYYMQQALLMVMHLEQHTIGKQNNDDVIDGCTRESRLLSKARHQWVVSWCTTIRLSDRA